MDDEYICRDEQARLALLKRYEERIDRLFALAGQARHLFATLAAQLSARRILSR